MVGGEIFNFKPHISGLLEPERMGVWVSNTGKKWADYEQLLKLFFHVFLGKKMVNFF